MVAILFADLGIELTSLLFFSIAIDAGGTPISYITPEAFLAD